jgi:serine/threonine-protein kinase HipA
MTDSLNVWCFGRRTGELRDTSGRLEFAYDARWVEDHHPPLSQSLPQSGAFSGDAVRAFFGGLLPEGEVRSLLARRLGLSAGNDFALLERVGGECAGAVMLLPPDEQPGDHPGSVTWLSDTELETLVAELPQRPMHVDDEGEYRLSLAGAQDKLPVVVDETGRVGLPVGSQPSTHVLKAPIARLPATVLNEAFCLAVGRELGLPVVAAEPRQVGEQTVLLVERYDRRAVDDGTVVRLHQEDFCQALGVPPERKYQREGGPGLHECFDLVNRAVAVPAAGAARLLDAWTLSFLLGNPDAHAKNFSLLSAPTETVVAPAYDVLCTVIYWKVKEMDRKMAMHVGGEYRPAYVRARHLDAMLQEAGMSPRLARRRVAALAARVVDAAQTVQSHFVADLWWDPFLDKAMDTVAQRASWLGEITAPRSTAARAT